LSLIASVCLLSAASLHLLGIDTHAGESSSLAAGFLAAAISQVIFATLFPIRPTPVLCRLVIVTNVLFILLYSAHVLIGLPQPNVQGLPWTLGPRENIDFPGVVTIAAELLAVVLAYRILFARSSVPFVARQG
jgi:hypothetical protein